MIADRRRDLLWIAAVSVAILALSSVPTWAGYRAETGELRFRGLYFDSQDYAVHLGAMQAGRQGEWAYQFRFTTEPHSPAYLRLFYIALGHVSAWLGLAPESMYHLARWVLGFLALLALYRLMGRIFADLFWRRTAFLLAALGSGLGWLQLIFGWTSTRISPIDFWLIDDYVFFSLSLFPHFAFVTIGMCLALTFWLDFLGDHDWTKMAGIASTAVLVQLANPIAFATVDASLVGAAIFGWWRTKEIRKADVGGLAAVALAQVPLLAYNFLVLNSDPLWSQFTAQNRTLSPPPDYYLWGFGLFWPFAIIGGFLALRRMSPPAGAALLWVIGGLLLAYAPLEIQRRFLQNVTIPLSILATTGLARLFELARAAHPGLGRWRSSLVALFIFLTSVSSIQLGLAQGPYLHTHPPNLYYPASLDSAVEWFQENARYNDFVLASEQTSQVLVQMAGLRAYAGHEMETLRYETKLREVDAFFQGRSPQLASPPVKWVVYGPAEEELGPGFEAPAHLRLVFDSDELRIYQVE